MKALAKVFDYGITYSKAGDPMINILFRYQDENDNTKDITWRGSLKAGKAQEITVDALLVCGLHGDKLEKLAVGAESGMLDRDKQVELTIEDETYEGKTFKRVKWVNEIGGGGFAARITESEALAKLSALNVGFTIAERRQKKGGVTPPARKNEPTSFNTEEEIPF